jgi:hypothetical protein
MQQAEHAAAEDILNEALRYLPNAETFQRQGRPEREIVNVAAEWLADLVIICPGPNTAANPRSALDRSDTSPGSSSTMLLVRCCWFGG